MTILIAMLLDACLREPPACLHPVVWAGHYLEKAGRCLQGLPPLRALLAGTLAWFAGAALFTGIYWFISQSLSGLPDLARWSGQALLLKPLFALRLLAAEVARVESALALDLEQGRRQLSRIVSRDTSALSATEVRESALESLSENLSDSVVAPLFWFAILGLPGAALYRFSNTADAMWGYRGKWEWAGKCAALMDDFLNLVPARLTALILFLVRPHAMGGLMRLAKEAGATPSPNSGWPMAALALTHRVRLGKPGVYVLNAAGAPPTAQTARACIVHVRMAGWLAALILTAGAICFNKVLHD